MQYKKPADPDKVIEIRLSEIKYYLTRNKHIKDRYDYQLIKRIPGLIIDGDLWQYKVEAQKVFESSEKCISVKEHFVDNKPWEETGLFKKVYKKKLKKLKEIKGCRNLKDLAALYRRYYDNLFHSIKQNGIISPEEDSSVAPIYADIENEGHYCYTYGGNHRLAMAFILNIQKMPVKIRARHKAWQRLRDELYTIGPTKFFSNIRI